MNSNKEFQDFKTKSFARKGTEALITSGAATKAFSGFIIGSTVPTITVLTTDPQFIGDYTSFEYVAGQYYPISGTAMTITAGSVLLIIK